MGYEVAATFSKTKHIMGLTNSRKSTRKSQAPRLPVGGKKVAEELKRVVQISGQKYPLTDSNVIRLKKRKGLR